MTYNAGKIVVASLPAGLPAHLDGRIQVCMCVYVCVCVCVCGVGFDAGFHAHAHAHARTDRGRIGASGPKPPT